jgi:hypothetical protein
MQRRRQLAHREGLILLRNYVSGNLRQELDKEIEDLAQNSSEEMAVPTVVYSWTPDRTKWTVRANPAK